jgi:SOS response regulatory protein OraA/RecX
VRAELRQLGVAASVAEDAAAPLEPAAADDAYRAAARRARQLGTLDEVTFTRRLSQYLARRGFDWETISATVARLWRERGLD